MYVNFQNDRLFLKEQAKISSTILSIENRETPDYQTDLAQYKPFTKYTIFASFRINKETQYFLIGSVIGLIIQIFAKKYLEYEKKNKPNSSNKNERRSIRVMKKIKGGDFIISPTLITLFSELGGLIGGLAGLGAFLSRLPKEKALEWTEWLTPGQTYQSYELLKTGKM